jgi:hypothetical protein
VHFVSGGAALEDTYALGEKDRISSSSMGDGRVAAVISHGNQYYGGIAVDGPAIGACFDCGIGGGYYGGPVATDPVELLTLGGFDVGHFNLARTRVATLKDPWWGFWGAPPVYVAGVHALIQGQTDAVVMDLTDPKLPTILRTVPLYSTAQDLQASGNIVLLSLSQDGVQRIDL